MGRSHKIFSKRKFRGNQHSAKESETSEDTDSANLQETTQEQTRPSCSRPIDQVTPGPSSETVQITPVSSSKKKLDYLSSDVVENMNSSSNKVIVDLNSLTKLIGSMCKCKFCGCENCLIVSEKEDKRQGIVTSLELGCNNCFESKSKRTSQLIKRNSNRIYESNLRFVYAMRCVGIGLAGSQTFCAMMNLPPPPTKFVFHYAILKDVLKEVAEESMKKAAEEAVVENSGNNDIAAAFDGSWQKRGYTSLNGVVTVTSFDTGKVLDVEVLSKYCQGCTKPNNRPGIHEGCVKNYEGSSGGMETDGIQKIFHRSERERGVRYTKFLGDGDSSSYPTIRDAKPYGNEIVIEKLECIGHIQKRVGSRLRKLKQKCNAMKLKLSDGLGLGGRGRLTDGQIDLLQTYYGLAVRRNVGSLKDMKSAIWAIYFHKLSTDENPRHELCPKGIESWCKYQKSLITKEMYHHGNSLPEPVMLQIKQIFRDLSKDDLLRKCLHGHTQNPNESLNHVIWSRVPKTVFVGFNTLVTGVMDAVITFNEGAMGRAAVFRKLNVDIGRNTQKGLVQIDKIRVRKADRAAESITKEGRVKKRQEKRKREDAEQENNVHYGPGQF